MKRTLLLTTVAALAISGIALATPGSGIVSAPVLARATFPDQFKIKLRDSSQGADVVVQQVTIAPGGQTGWHTHPGPAIVLVKSGTFTLYDGDDPSCTGNSYGPGQGFVDQGYGHVHIGRNEGATNVELYVTFLDVPIGGAPRIDAANPGNCPF
jgi:mannose-6-phosphate isomerase-like protein (cupin superfamily)